MKIKCPCWGKEYVGEYYDDCPVCDWQYDGLELVESELWDEDYAPPNPVCLGKASQLYKEGKNIWGEKLKSNQDNH